MYTCLRVTVTSELIPVKHLELCLARTCWLSLCVSHSAESASSRWVHPMREVHLPFLLCFQALLSAHDMVAQKDFEPLLPPLPDNIPESEEAMRIVCLVKNQQPLVRKSSYCYLFF